MRTALALLVAAGALTASALAATAPTYSVTFMGTGTERQLDHLRNIQDSGLCDSAQHVDVSASLSWAASWKGVRATSAGVPTAVRIDGSTVSGTDVKDACGFDLSFAPPGWVNHASCSAGLVVSAAPTLAVRKSATSLVVAVTAPAFAVPVGVGCSINPRNDQLIAHAAVALKKLTALRKGKSLSVAVGTSRPGPGDVYAPSVDCSQPTKPYEGYRTADECRDDLTWSGTVTVTRTS